MSGGASLDFSGIKKLAGREEQVDALKASLEKSLQGHGQSVFVRGRSGTGKSTLVVQTLAGDNRGGEAAECWFVSGKYDQVGISTPYAALVEALGTLCKCLQEEWDDPELNLKIQEAIGDDADLLASVVPEIANLITIPASQVDEESQLPIRSASVSDDDNYSVSSHNSSIGGNKRRLFKAGWAFQRLKINFCIFLQLVCAHSKPLILFLDDLQWADVAVLELMQSLQSGMESSRFLLIGAYRDDEFDSSSNSLDPIPNHLSKLLQHDSATPLALGNLSIEGVNSLVATIIGRHVDDTMSLAEVVYRKTDGNIFYVLQFLGLLQKDNMLFYSFQELNWQWDTALIHSKTRLAGNVVDLVATKIKGLSQDVQQGLMVAACLGNQFDADIVSKIVSVWNQSSTLEDSWHDVIVAGEDSLPKAMTLVDSTRTSPLCWDVAVESRLIDRARHGAAVRYRFSHDRIQQAAASLVTQGREQTLLHLRIGRFLLRQYHDLTKRQDWMLLVAINQLNKSLDFIDDPDERFVLAKLNQQAAENVAAKSAFYTAAKFLRIGMDLLGDFKWSQHYDETLRMAAKSAEYEYCCGHFEQCKTRVAEVLVQARSFEDKVDVYFTLIESLGAQKKDAQALDVGYNLLAELGFRFPKKVQVYHLAGEYLKAKRMLRGFSDDELVHLAEATDTKAINALKVLACLTTFAWFGDHMEAFALLIIRMLTMSLKYGATKYTAVAYSFFGVVFTKFFEMKEAIRMGKLGVRMLGRFGKDDPDIASRVVFVSTAFLSHLNQPFHDMLNPLLEAHATGLKTGDLAYGMISSSAYCICYFMCGLPLKALDDDAANFAAEMFKYNQLTALSPCVLHHQACQNLMGLSPNPLRLEGSVIENIDSLLQQGTDVENSRTEQVYSTLMMQLAYSLGQYTLAEEMAMLNLKHKDVDFPFFIATAYAFWRGLIFFALAQQPTTTGRKVRSFCRQARHQLKILQRNVGKGGMINCHHMLMLLLAEEEATKFLLQKKKRRDDDRKSQAIRVRYDQAIQACGRSGFPQMAALGNLQAGLFVRHGSDTIKWWAGVYLTHAVELYAEWGAQAMVTHLEKDYSDLLEEASRLDDKKRSTHVKGRRRFDPRTAELHASNDFLGMSDEEGESENSAM